MSIGLQANFKATNIAEVEVNAYSVKVAESSFSVQGGNVDSYSQVMNAKQSGNGPDNYNAPVEEKAAIGAKIFGVGMSGEVTVNSDRHGNRSNEKITVKQTASEGSFSTSKVTEFQGGKTTERIENSYTIGGALLIGVELKIDMSKRIKDNQK